jgi:DNA/RNA-binding domain of Phe-tRNA-synthetase-like protein
MKPEPVRKGEGAMITVSEEWRMSFPGTAFGFLAVEGVGNSLAHEGIEDGRAGLEEELRSRWSGTSRSALKGSYPFEAYERYFRKFGQGYPVLHQLETVAIKGKPIMSPSSLVACMFMAELETGFLTAGHDLDRCIPPFRLDVAHGGEAYRSLGGKERKLMEGDMYLSDGQGIVSSVLYGPDDRTFVTLQTTRVLFTVYGVPKIPASELATHLGKIEELTRILSPSSERIEFGLIP